MSDPEAFARYLRAGRRYGVGPEFWAAAEQDLGARDLARLVRNLGAERASAPSSRRLPAAATAGRSSDRPVAVNTFSPCGECGAELPARNRSGVCRRCQARLAMRRRRARKETAPG